MMDIIKALATALQLDEVKQAPLTVTAIIVIVAWWVYSKAEQAMKEERERVRTLYGALYSPALGLLECRSSGRMTVSESQSRLTELLIAHRANANPECLEEMNRWLQGDDNEPELQYCVEEACASARGTLLRRQVGIWATVWWLVDTYDKISKLVLAVGVLALSLWVFVYIVERHVGKVLLCVMLVTIAAQALRSRRQSRAARGRQERIAQIRTEKRSRSRKTATQE